MQSRLLLPAFETLHWHVAASLATELKSEIFALCAGFGPVIMSFQHSSAWRDSHLETYGCL